MPKTETTTQHQDLHQFHLQLLAKTIVVQAIMIITTTTITNETALEVSSNKIITRAITRARVQSIRVPTTLQQPKEVPMLRTMTELQGPGTITTSHVITRSSELMLQVVPPHNRQRQTVQLPIITTISNSQRALLMLEGAATMLPSITVHSPSRNRRHRNRYNTQPLKRRPPTITTIISRNKEPQTHRDTTLKIVELMLIIIQQQ
jgi:hypothetical protein